MTEQGDAVGIFEEALDGILRAKLKDADEMVKAIDNSWDQADIVEVLTEANAYVKMVCGDDVELYDEWRYRMFIGGNGTTIIVQGTEVHTELPCKFGDARDEDLPSKKKKRK